MPPPSQTNKRKRSEDDYEEQDSRQNYQASFKAPRLSECDGRVSSQTSFDRGAPRYDSPMQGVQQRGILEASNGSRRPVSAAGYGQQRGRAKSSRHEQHMFDPMDDVNVRQKRAHRWRYGEEAAEWQKRPAGQKKTDGETALDAYVEHFKKHKIRKEDIDGAKFAGIWGNPGENKNLAEAHSAVGAWIFAGMYEENFGAKMFSEGKERTKWLQAGCIFSGTAIGMQYDRKPPITDLSKCTSPDLRACFSLTTSSPRPHAVWRDKRQAPLRRNHRSQG